MAKVFATRKCPGMFQTKRNAIRTTVWLFVSGVVVWSAGVGLWKGVGRGLSLTLANPVPFHCGCVAGALAITCVIFASKRFLAYRNWGHWAWGAFFFAGTSIQSFYTMGGA